jgi:hypothetical protein
VCLIEELNEEEEEERYKNGGLLDGKIAVANADLSSLLAANESGPIDWSIIGFLGKIPIVSNKPSQGTT